MPTTTSSSYPRIVQCLTQIFRNVVDVPDPNAETNHFRRDSCLGLFRWRKLPVRGRRRDTTTIWRAHELRSGNRIISSVGNIKSANIRSPPFTFATV